MSQYSTLFVGLDVHKESISVGYAPATPGADVVFLGRSAAGIATSTPSSGSFSRRPASCCLSTKRVPAGTWLYRYLEGKGLRCLVVATSLIPRKPGDRVKTDRRDAVQLARLARPGDLEPVYVPTPQDEAVRDLSRAREATLSDLKSAKHRLKSLLLRHDIRYSGKKSWTPAHLRWLATLKMPLPAQQIVFQECLQTISQHKRATGSTGNRELREQTDSWRLRPVVEAFQALRGVQFHVGVTVAAELGDPARFDCPTEVFAYVGLHPSERTSGERRRQGGIAKIGNGHARRVLVEAAWAYRFRARISPQIQQRQETLEPCVRDIAWKAQIRLCKRFRALVARGKHPNVAVTAIARELVGFMWSIGRQVPLAAGTAAVTAA